ncbi:site-specific integrase [Pokkaliibacter sp. CJK22405]|uniref:site-specific integrase n=1 Tax=Pokkaliibacter sp. CJK22405 TaxID=3384615 RepID=UPI003984CA8F
MEILDLFGKDGNQGIVNEQFYSMHGYPFKLLDDKWQLSKDISLSIGKLCRSFPGDTYALRQVLAFFGRHNSPSHLRNLMERLLHYIKSLNGAEVFSVESLISYHASLDDLRAWYLSVIRILIRKWVRLGYPGVPEDSLRLLDNIRIKGNQKGRAVQSRCSEDGPLTDIEMQSVIDAVTHSFCNGILGLNETVILMTLAMTGRRPNQVSALKIKDIIQIEDKYFINFPRSKQRYKGWRSSFRKYRIIEDLWLLLKKQADYVRKIFSQSVSPDVLHQDLEGELPLFPKMPKNISLLELREVLESDRLHIPSMKIYHIVVNAGEKVNAVSERTGKPIHLNPYRFRYTLGTNLAREGSGIYVIAEALDHTDTQNAGVYTKSDADIVERLNKSVALEMAPFAQAFRGVVIQSEKDTLRANDPSSRVSNGKKNVGSCGSYGFCGALAPFACYTCSHFQPWKDGPHEEVLNALINERERVNELTGDIKIAAANDRLIYAVGEVVRRCGEARGKLSNG